MQPPEKNSPSEEHESIQYYVLEGLFPPTHVFALNLGEQQCTECDCDLLQPLLAQYPQWVPYEIIHASFYQGYDRLSEQRIVQAQTGLDLLREEKLWDAELRPIRNVMARLRLKLREVGLETINMLETGSTC